MKVGVFLCTGGCLLVACVGTGTNNAPSPQRPTAEAVDALHRGDVNGAAQYVEQAVGGVKDGPGTLPALLLGAIVDLHPRNDTRNPDRAAELAARYVGAAQNEWQREVGIALFEIALGMGAHPRTAAAGGALPRLPQDARSSAERILQLQQEIERLQKELTRIRETLKR